MPCRHSHKPTQSYINQRPSYTKPINVNEYKRQTVSSYRDQGSSLYEHFHQTRIGVDLLNDVANHGPMHRQSHGVVNTADYSDMHHIDSHRLEARITSRLMYHSVMDVRHFKYNRSLTKTDIRLWRRNNNHIVAVKC